MKTIHYFGLALVIGAVWLYLYPQYTYEEASATSSSEFSRPEPQDSRSHVVVPSSRRYDDMLANVLSLRQELSSGYESGSVTLDSAGDMFEKWLIDSVVPYWYGTPWDFNGYSNVPNEGVIACGYFVSTTLKHMGIHLNRYQMAQQAALTEIKCLEPNGEAIVFYKKGDDVEGLCKQIRDSLDDGLYMLGLDFHVGYLHLTPEGMFFIHSAYYDPLEVTREKAVSSMAFAGSSGFAIGRISHNPYLIKSWLKGSSVPTLNCE